MDTTPGAYLADVVAAISTYGTDAKFTYAPISAATAILLYGTTNLNVGDVHPNLIGNTYIVPTMIRAVQAVITPATTAAAKPTFRPGFH